MQNLSERKRYLAGSASRGARDISILGTCNRPMREGANRIGSVQLGLRPHVLEEETF